MIGSLSIWVFVVAFILLLGVIAFIFKYAGRVIDGESNKWQGVGRSKGSRKIWHRADK